MHEEEIVSPEPFKFSPDPEQDQPGLGEREAEESEQSDAGYTPGETEYADGDGTKLDQEINELEDDDLDEDGRNSALGHS